MSISDQLYTAFTLVFTHGCHLALLAISSLSYFRTKRAGFLFIAVGFLLALIQPLALWLLIPHFSESVERLATLVKSTHLLYPVSSIMILIGFYMLFVSKDSRYLEPYKVRTPRSATNKQA